MSRGLKNSRFLGHFFDTFLSIPHFVNRYCDRDINETAVKVNAMLAITLALLPYFIHEIYQSIQKELKKEYILMLRLEGASNWILLKETILPNIYVSYIREIAKLFTIAILDISALSFISLELNVLHQNGSYD